MALCSYCGNNPVFEDDLCKECYSEREIDKRQAYYEAFD